jgi:alpha-beta hydrolase superfamily lysophospholipase
MIRCVLALAAARVASETAHVAEQSIAVASLRVTSWSPPPDGVKQPVMILSHGFHGCDTQSRFLMAALAGAGYLVLAPNHRDAD